MEATLLGVAGIAVVGPYHLPPGLLASPSVTLT